MSSTPMRPKDPMIANRHSILVLGAYRQSLAIARSLGKRHQVILGSATADSYISKSRFVSRTWIHPALDPAKPCAFLNRLNQLVDEQPNIKLIFPVGDIEIEFLARNRSRLPRSVVRRMLGRRSRRLPQVTELLTDLRSGLSSDVSSLHPPEVGLATIFSLTAHTVMNVLAHGRRIVPRS